MQYIIYIIMNEGVRGVEKKENKEEERIRQKNDSAKKCKDIPYMV